MIVLKNAFAIIHTWPDLRNAEYEVLQRILAAAANVGIEVVVIDDNAQVLWATEGLSIPHKSRLPEDAVDFAISLHFLSPRVVDLHTYYAIWQPIEFYHDFGYLSSIEKLSSHIDLISCDSDLADAHALNIFSGLGREPQLPLPRMFHTLPEPFLKPNISSDSRLFYIGINWERLGRPKGRFHDLLVALDNKDLLDIYGPELVHGVAPWAGFESYRGELPFDGNSVKHAINHSGICLAFSSVPHKNAGIMSNRLFEGLAGGAAIIATPNALIDKYFSDVVYLVDDSRGEAALGQQVLTMMRRIRDNPEEAKRRVLEGQRILRETCSLERSLLALCEQTPARKAHFEDQFLAPCEVTVVLDARGGTLSGVLAAYDVLKAQTRTKIDLHLICDERFANQHRATLAPGKPSGALRSVVLCPGQFQGAPSTFDGPPPRNQRSGPLTRDALKSVKTKYFALMDLQDQLFHDHFASLAKAFELNAEARLACSGIVIQTQDTHGLEARRFEGLKFSDRASLIAVTGEGHRGRFMFRSELAADLPPHLFDMLDGEEHNYFRLAGALSGPLAESDYVSYSFRQSGNWAQFRGTDAAEYQRQYIRDTFARDSRMSERSALYQPGALTASSAQQGPAVRWTDFTVPFEITHRMPVSRTLSAGLDGPALRYLTSGFAPAEPEFSWLTAERGTIDFVLPERTSRFESYELVLSGSGRRSAVTGLEQRCAVALNGKLISYVRVPEHYSDIVIALPTSLTEQVRSCRVELIPDHAEQVFGSAGEIADERRLSLRLTGVTLVSRTQPVPVFAPGQVYGCTTLGRGSEALVEGFYAPEADLTWVAGLQGDLRFALSSEPNNPVLNLDLIARTSLLTGKLQDVTISVNERLLGVFELKDGRQTLNIKLLPEDLAGSSIKLRLTAAHAEAVFDEAHDIVDGRLLGVAVCAIAVLEDVQDGVSHIGDSTKAGSREESGKLVEGKQ